MITRRVPSLACSSLRAPSPWQLSMSTHTRTRAPVAQQPAPAPFPALKLPKHRELHNLSRRRLDPGIPICWAACLLPGMRHCGRGVREENSPCSLPLPRAAAAMKCCQWKRELGDRVALSSLPPLSALLFLLACPELKQNC